MSKFHGFAVAISSVVGALALAGTASAGTAASLAVGPVPIPDVPVQVCISQTDVPGGAGCVGTPAGRSVSLVVNVQSATSGPVVVPPSVVRSECPTGTQGVAARVSTGSVSGAAISGAATVTLNNGSPVMVPVNRVVAGSGQTLTIFACSGVSP
ncbi:hypothetical protein ACVGVM_16235 [Pseudonocardia bannensis]|uniref:Uncharacterized protein n=1 Tax=Pseudonocardia bannensis TaxID=630973 RepID=A0A848DKM1_9PSEU|nr:hypothetical protein [Pseudonocardia bannensis]NMH93248.1 hypothetical protein [Pseudonocardia bannensis]